MASSRDDFIIAIRSAFLKKSTQQKFSLLSLVFTSIFIIVLSNLDFKAVRYLKIGINELVYRSSFVVSIPENFIKDTFIEVSDYTTFFNDYKKKRLELSKLKSNFVSSEIIQNENRELKELINDYVSTSDKILAKIIVDHESPFLKSIIINKGSKDNIKIGTNIYDQSYLVGRVIEVNYKTSRVLLLSDLNSNVPVTIAPQNIQAIVTGSGDNYGQIKYIKDGLSKEIEEESIIYTSGTGAIFKSGIPIGTLGIIKENSLDEFRVEFYSDFSQLKYVFAEITSTSEIPDQNVSEPDNETNNSINAKLKILEDELEIIEETNSKFLEENINLKSEINNLNNKLLILNNELSSKNITISQFNIDKTELEFLRLNLEFGHKCRKSNKLFQKSVGFEPESDEYKKCVLNRGTIIND
ncbi:rod shape-determining protein MreC [Candidatus Pelagibacter sp.]|nr:rod shape-determining protein MreC [Candidatus Pelagibacter sp.]